MTNYEKLWEVLLAILLASAGGYARMLGYKDHKNVSWKHIASCVFISGFSGLMALFTARAMGYTGDWLHVVSGMAGYAGPYFLEGMVSLTTRKIGVDVGKDLPPEG